MVNTAPPLTWDFRVEGIFYHKQLFFLELRDFTLVLLDTPVIPADDEDNLGLYGHNILLI